MHGYYYRTIPLIGSGVVTHLAHLEDPLYDLYCTFLGGVILLPPCHTVNIVCILSPLELFGSLNNLSPPEAI